MKPISISSNFLTLTALYSGSLRRKIESELDLSYGEFMALSAIYFDRVSSVSELAKQLPLTPSRASLITKRLAEQGYIYKRRHGATDGRILISEGGEAVVRKAFALTDETYDELISPINQSLKASFVAGLIATAVVVNGMTYRGQTPDVSVMCSTVFLHTEQTIIKEARNFGLSFADFRVLVAIAKASGALTVSKIEHYLIMPKSTVSESVSKLKRKGLITSTRIDGRSSLLMICPHAEDEVDEILRSVEASAIRNARPVRQEERDLYYLIVDETVAALRKGKLPALS